MTTTISGLRSREEQARLFLDQELRHIEGSKLNRLSAIIDNSKDYNILLAELTKLNQDGKPALHLSTEAIQLIKNQIHCGKSPSMALLNHWAISGRRRPTIETLLVYLQLCNLKRAEEYVLQGILGFTPEPIMRIQNDTNRPLPLRMPADNNVMIDEEYKFYNLSGLAQQLSARCKRYSFDLIYHSTNKFRHEPYNFKTKLGTKIGGGTFSSVYRASTKLVDDVDAQEQTVAAKLLVSKCDESQLVKEINLMKKVNHENVLKFLGLALGETQEKQLAYICLIYPYMENGSLQECLREGIPLREFSFLSWPERVMIATKVARGISYLHNFKEGPIVHRDIKTANILLDENVEPKLGDFNTVRKIEGTDGTIFTQNIIGTSVYMAREAFMGKISSKLDTFSFGIVLLELLTGMRPERSIDDEEGEDLLSYITERVADLEEADSSQLVAEILDEKAGRVVRPDEPKIIFLLALRATEENRYTRPAIDDILPELEQLMVAR